MCGIMCLTWPLDRERKTVSLNRYTLLVSEIQEYLLYDKNFDFFSLVYFIRDSVKARQIYVSKPVHNMLVMIAFKPSLANERI
jgi:hypothetical protein